MTLRLIRIYDKVGSAFQLPAPSCRVFPLYSAHLAPASTRMPPQRAPAPRAFDPGRGARAYGFAFVAAIHVALFAGLWHTDPVRRALTASAPVIVQLLKPDPPAPPPPPPARPGTATAYSAPTPPPPIDIPELATALPAPTAQWVAPPPSPTPAVELAVAPPADAAPVAQVTPPRFDADYLRNPAPAYPALARRNGEEGRVLLRVLVGADGDAERVELKSSSGSERLDAAALETVKRWKFVPAKLGSEPVAAWVVVPVAFTLRR